MTDLAGLKRLAEAIPSLDNFKALVKLAVPIGRDGDKIAIERAHLAALLARVETLERMLGYFMTDTRFVVSVGGNPIVVDKMLAEVSTALGTQP